MKDYPQRTKVLEPFKLNREIAYKGSIGQKRKDFCVDYIGKKGEIFKTFQDSQIKDAAKSGEEITCQKGCSYCCCHYVQASIKECEAIVYYLYHNEDALSTFLENYPVWREELRKNGDIFEKCGQLWQEKTNPYAGTGLYRALEKEVNRYKLQNIPCPFLHNNLCLIYEVRPFPCAAIFAVTPPEWCNPSNPNKPKVYQTKTFMKIDTPFYYKDIDGIVMTFMPLAVYGILKDGYKLLSKIPGLKGLEEEVKKSLGSKRL